MLSNTVKTGIMLVCFTIVSVFALTLWVIPVQHWDLQAWIFLLLVYLVCLKTFEFLSNEKEDEF